MTCRPWRLESYDSPGSGGPAQSSEQDTLEGTLEEVRLEAFDKGYKAGWEDADNAHQADRNHVTAELANNLQAMSFTYEEARQATMKDTEILFRGMLGSVLPKVLPEALTANILERLLEGAQTASAATVEITIAPDNVERLETLIDGKATPPLRICPEETLGLGQAFLRFETREERIDLEEVLTELEMIVADLFVPGQLQKENRDVE